VNPGRIDTEGLRRMSAGAFGRSIAFSRAGRILVARRERRIYGLSVPEHEKVSYGSAVLRIQPNLADFLARTYMIAGLHGEGFISAIDIDIAGLGLYEDHKVEASGWPR